MKKQSAFLSSKVLFVTLVIAASLMLLGSFVDYPLSCALYNRSNPIAIFFAAYGAIPAALGWVAAGCLLLHSRNRQNKVVSIVQSVGSAILIFLGTLIACIMPTIYLSVPLFLPITVGLTLSIGTMLLVHHLARGADHIVIIRAAAAIFLVILCEIMLVNCVKVF